MAVAGPAGAFLVELLIYNGRPFKDYWAYFVRSHANPEIGVLINAAGDVRNGFQFEVKRSHDFNATGNFPKRIPLQWVDAKYFDEKAMLNDGKRKVDHEPVCGFEASAHKAEAPKKSLNAVEDVVSFQLDFCRKNTMCMWETSGWVGKCMRAPRCIYAHFILLRIYGCQYDAWKMLKSESVRSGGSGEVLCIS